MDKIATNNFLVDLRDDVKAAKAMVAGNFVRKIKELKKALEKDGDSGHKDKTEKKIAALHDEIKLLKGLDAYQIGKRALLKSDLKYWNDLIGDSKASNEDKVMARVIAKNRIQKRVIKFRTDHGDCDEWLEEYFEFREKKRELTEAKISKAKAKKMRKRDSNGSSNSERTPNRGPRNRRPNMKSRPANNSNHREHNKSKYEKTPREPRANHNEGRARRASDKTGNDTPRSGKESLHPSWASKRKEKEALKAALSGKIQPKRIILNSA